MNVEFTLTKEQLIAEIMYLGMLVQYKTEHCIFVNFSGHVDQLEIRIRENKKQYNEEIADTQIYTRKSYNDSWKASDIIDSENRIIERLKGIKSTLTNILENGKIDYGNLEEYTVKVTKYRF